MNYVSWWMLARLLVVLFLQCIQISNYVAHLKLIRCYKSNHLNKKKMLTHDFSEDFFFLFVLSGWSVTSIIWMISDISILYCMTMPTRMAYMNLVLMRSLWMPQSRGAWDLITLPPQRTITRAPGKVPGIIISQLLFCHQRFSKSNLSCLGVCVLFIPHA